MAVVCKDSKVSELSEIPRQIRPWHRTVAAEQIYVSQIYNEFRDPRSLPDIRIAVSVYAERGNAAGFQLDIVVAIDDIFYSVIWQVNSFCQI